MMKLVYLLGATLAASVPANAATTIDFSSSPSCNTCTSFVDSGVTFTNKNGTSSLGVANYGNQSDGPGLGVFSDTDGNYLLASLSGTADSVSLEFGNDDPYYTNAGDLAVLNVYLAGVLVGTSTVVLNRDDIMNQSISYSGGLFDSFTFAYTNASGVPYTGGGNVATGLTEVVDNVTFNLAAVPEPTTWAMMLFGFGAMGVAMRRDRKLRSITV